MAFQRPSCHHFQVEESNSSKASGSVLPSSTTITSKLEYVCNSKDFMACFRRCGRSRCTRTTDTKCRRSIFLLAGCGITSRIFRAFHQYSTCIVSLDLLDDSPFWRQITTYHRLLDNQSFRDIELPRRTNKKANLRHWRLFLFVRLPRSRRTFQSYIRSWVVQGSFLAGVSHPSIHRNLERDLDAEHSKKNIQEYSLRRKE